MIDYKKQDKKGTTRNSLAVSRVALNRNPTNVGQYKLHPIL